MENYNIVEAERTKQGIIIHKVDRGRENLEAFKYNEMWIGLCWPIRSQHAYYCIVGEEWQDHDYLDKKREQGPLKFFTEHQAKSLLGLDHFFSKLTDDVARYHCTKIYTLTGDEYRGRVKLYEDYIRDRDLKLAHLYEAPYADDFLWGVTVINRYIEKGKLILSDSIVLNQLKSISKEELDEDPEGKFLAINGLRYVVGAFYQHVPQPVPDWIFRKRKRPWMAL